MIYSSGDIYEGAWENDLKHGYGILEKKNGDKYYGYWNNGLKEGQGYFYYSNTSKIYLGEWHDDVPRCGIFTDVDEEQKIKKTLDDLEDQPMIPILKLRSPDGILEDSISNIYFLKSIKMAKSKTFRELFPADSHADMIKIFKEYSPKIVVPEEEKENENKIPDNILSLAEFKKIASESFQIEFDDQSLELILYVFGLSGDDRELKIDFLLFSRLLFLGCIKMNTRVNEKSNEFGEIINLKQNQDVSRDKIEELHKLNKEFSVEDEEYDDDDEDGINFDDEVFEDEY